VRGRGLLLGAFLALAAPSAAAQNLRVTILTPPLAVPPFALADAHGRPRSRAMLRGHWSLLYMGFTHCPDLCPMTLANLVDIVGRMKKIPGAPVPAIIFLAVDPKRDKPLLAEYLAHYGAGILGITGPQKAVDALAAGLGGFVVLESPDQKGDYDVAHSSEISIIDPKARVRARLTPPMPAAETAHYLARLFAGSGPAAESRAR
jgi:protein SCO1/2